MNHFKLNMVVFHNLATRLPQANTGRKETRDEYNKEIMKL